MPRRQGRGRSRGGRLRRTARRRAAASAVLRPGRASRALAGGTFDRLRRHGTRDGRDGGARGEGGGGRRRNWNGSGCGRRRRVGRGNGRRGGRTRREQRRRVDVPVGLARAAHAEVHVRRVVLELAALADRPHLLGLRDGHARRDGERAEVEQRHAVTVGRLDRERASVSGERACEPDGPGGRSEDRLARRACDVDAPMLAGFVLARRNDEGRQHRTGCRPAPRAGDRRDRERRDGRAGQQGGLCCQMR